MGLYKKSIFGIAGATASGKSTVANYLKVHHQAEVFATRDVLVSEATVRQLPQDKTSLQNLFATLTTETGNEAILMDRLTIPVECSTASIVVIEGCRRMSDLEGLRRIATSTERKLILLYLDVPQEVRFRRMNERAMQNHKQLMTFEEFVAGEGSKSEVELEQLKVLFCADGQCVQNGSIPVRDLYDIIEDHVGTLVY